MNDQVLSTGPDAKVVYSTATGDEPRGSVSLTKEATEPLPEPTKRIAKKTTKKRSPRVSAKAVDTHSVTVDPRVMQAVRRVIKEGKYTKPQIINEETVIVR